MCFRNTKCRASRTEYTDTDVHFVIEGLSISSLRLSLGHAHISTTSDIDIPPSPAGTKPDAPFTKINIRVQGIRATFREASFRYHDKIKSGGAAPKEYTGLLDVTLPETGFNVDITLSVIPIPNLRDREQTQGFFKIEKINVNISPEITLAVKKSNHQLLVDVFKPIFKNQFRSSLEQALKEQISLVVQTADRVAWDTHQRAKVFIDGGAPTQAAYIGGLWGGLGRMRQLPELFVPTGWHLDVDGGGVVKGDPRTDHAFTTGTEQQMLSRDKDGPAGNFSEKNLKPLEDTSTESQGSKQALLQKSLTLKKLVDVKFEEETKRAGWRSPAFDGLAAAWSWAWFGGSDLSN